MNFFVSIQGQLSTVYNLIFLTTSIYSKLTIQCIVEISIVVVQSLRNIYILCGIVFKTLPLSGKEMEILLWNFLLEYIVKCVELNVWDWWWFWLLVTCEDFLYVFVGLLSSMFSFVKSYFFLSYFVLNDRRFSGFYIWKKYKWVIY